MPSIPARRQIIWNQLARCFASRAEKFGNNKPSPTHRGGVVPHSMKKTTPCPLCGGGINPAALLGAMNAGKQKKFSAAELARRRKRLAEVRAKRWPKRSRKCTPETAAPRERPRGAFYLWSEIATVPTSLLFALCRFFASLKQKDLLNQPPDWLATSYTWRELIAVFERQNFHMAATGCPVNPRPVAPIAG